MLDSAPAAVASYPLPQPLLTINPAGDAALQRGSLEATHLLKHLFRSFDGHLALRLWNGKILSLGQGAPVDAAHAFMLICHTPQIVRAIVLGRDRLRLAEAYFRGDIDIEGSFFAALRLKDHLNSICLSSLDRLRAVFKALRLHAATRSRKNNTPGSSSLHARVVKRHSKTENQGAIQFHYDVSNVFYALWLDKAMVYSCAYFEQPDDTLEQAQQAKLEHICRKLLLKSGDHFLDIGCGWGALIIYATQHYGVRAHGITLSQRQLDMARHRIAQAGIEDRVSVELCDYRDLPGQDAYDKIASIGMFEHVGLKNLPAYFAKVIHLLKPGGLFLNHGITHDVEGWEKTSSTEFINRYVFPDGQLDTISNIQRGMERAGLEIADVESLRAHYALTLRHWVARLEQTHEQALEHVSEPTWRIWRLYMAACALEFESGEIGIYQVLASKRVRSPTALPLTRRYLYPAVA
ncbi:SAM-dependent methyltransferase [Uliginosibacterium aquaticum]|uniref:Class I SAM-dependent methyltransferase n=1 Tax=Uliginosibacterium aquaticum TaxID=2731212 RepID=A0ABX2IEQ1_9RHOO|nr:cyclopropane-fatty-acyl-phospholipid synthase family protein [Uliginosibacterium aquaticum]NSL55068.1 class I SAM-dependent methyltransferase [Uliginosibacterium aquaticum]